VLHIYHFDDLGSVITLSNVNGGIVERYSYDVFGKPTDNVPYFSLFLNGEQYKELNNAKKIF
jgi:hypothetical protein